MASILRRLRIEFPDAACALSHHSPFELLVATILSAQCTDERVNQVTPALFKSYPDPWSMASASLENLETLIRSTGFFKNKARHLKYCAQQIVEKHGGTVPSSMEALTLLPGVGRKTANVVLGNAFGVPGLPVDTHVTRLSGRLGLSNSSDPVVIEKDLCAIIPEAEWTEASHLLILHGRATCAARKPRCPLCTLHSLCPSATL